MKPLIAVSVLLVASAPMLLSQSTPPARVKTAVVAQKPPQCSSVTFQADFSQQRGFEHYIGDGIWFVIYKWQEPTGNLAFRMMVGPNRVPAERFDTGWLIDSENPISAEWELGPTYGKTRRVSFALKEEDFVRFRKAVHASTTSDRRVVFSEEANFCAVALQIPKGLVLTKNFDYKLSASSTGTEQSVESGRLDVTVVTPSEFALVNGIPSVCAMEIN